ncbi:MAG: hypothetical protein J1E65_01310 [Lachnospiraceae bacterium]|nr:hypothetical protein [Lachnospiraceae bacterium]
MSAKTKIVVIHVKELIYTGIFVVLGILFVVLLLIMFLPKNDKTEEDGPTGIPEETQTEPGTEAGTEAVSGSDAAENIEISYIPGVYTTSLVLNEQAVDIEVIVDKNAITSIRMVNLDDAIATMYPLVQPSLESLAAQIYEKQSLDDLSYPMESKYTSLILLDAVQTALDKAIVYPETEEGILP